jgi:NAD(P)H-dependent FMN reductase
MDRTAVQTDVQPTQSDALVVAICGSLADDSVTRLALDRALDAVADAGAETDLVDLREYDLPLLDPDVDSSADAEDLAARVDEADALVLGTPMYNGSYSSPMKTAIDYSDPESFDGMPVALVGVSGGQFPRRALDHLRGVTSHMGARVLADEAAVPESYHVDDELPKDVADRLADLGETVVDRAVDRPTAAGCSAAVADD